MTLYAPWRTFEDFLADVGRPASLELCFARKDKSQGFAPENCCWMTRSDASKINAAYMKATERLTGRKKKIYG